MSAATIHQIGAVARRDLRIEVSYQFQLALNLVTVLFAVGTSFFIAELVDSSALDEYGGDYFSFALVGILIMNAAVLGLGTFTARIGEEQRAGTLEVLLSTPTRLPTLLTGTFVVPAVMTAVQTALYLLIGAALGFSLPMRGLLVGLPVLILTVAIFGALGVLAASLIVLVKRGDPISGLVIQTTNFLAGAVFPVALLPGWLQVVARLIPAYYSLNGLRAALINDAGLADIAPELAALAGFTVVLVPLALWAFRTSVRIAQVTGTLANY